jgi:hypothetical protein
MHDMKLVPVVNAMVDVEIIPLIEWLNTLPGVTTCYSCQGDEDSKPYVLFRCEDEEGLYPIYKQLTGYADLIWNAQHRYGIRYAMYFHDIHTFHIYMRKHHGKPSVETPENHAY